MVQTCPIGEYRKMRKHIFNVGDVNIHTDTRCQCDLCVVCGPGVEFKGRYSTSRLCKAHFTALFIAVLQNQPYTEGAAWVNTARCTHGKGLCEVCNECPGFDRLVHIAVFPEGTRGALKQPEPPRDVGACCWICGRGATPRKGAVTGLRTALVDLGYDCPPNKQPRAHASCVTRARKKLGLV